MVFSLIILLEKNKSLGKSHGSSGITNDEPVGGIVLEGADPLQSVVLEEGCSWVREVEPLLDFCEGVSGVIDVLLGNITGALVEDDCGSGGGV